MGAFHVFVGRLYVGSGSHPGEISSDPCLAINLIWSQQCYNCWFQGRHPYSVKYDLITLRRLQYCTVCLRQMKSANHLMLHVMKNRTSCVFSSPPKHLVKEHVHPRINRLPCQRLDPEGWPVERSSQILPDSTVGTQGERQVRFLQLVIDKVLSLLYRRYAAMCMQ